MYWTGLRDLQQSERLHGWKRELSLHQPTRTRSAQRGKGRRKPVSANDRLEGRIRQVSGGCSPVTLGRIANGWSPVLELKQLLGPQLLEAGVMPRGRFSGWKEVVATNGPSISQEFLKLKMSNFVHREILWQITSKTGVVGFTWPIFACATVDLEKFRHGMLLTKINNAVDSGPLLLALTVLDVNDAIH